MTTLFSWFFRLFKGFVVGTGFIIPGVSGGVFAAIFGIYEPMIRFFGNITKDFWKNVKFFFPVGIGGIISIVLVSRLLGEFFEIAEVPLIWFFIGCVLGTLPLLYQKSGELGRESRHFIILMISCMVMFVFLVFIQDILAGVKIPTENFVPWLFAGVLMALGAIIPGLSPSNFILYLGMYGEMMERIGRMELGVIVPVLVGAGVCIILLSRAFDRLFDHAYTGMYHFIIGIIIASTIMIIPWSGKVLENGSTAYYDTKLGLICLIATLVGIILGYGMSFLEQYKPKNKS